MYSSRRAARALAASLSGALLCTVFGVLAPGSAAAVTGGEAATLSGVPDVGLVGEAYDFTFTVTGNPTCSVIDGELPAGITLDSSACRLAGTPTTGGDHPVTIAATNGTAPIPVLNTSVTVNQAPALTDTGVPDATDGTPFSHQFHIVGFPAPELTLEGAALPDGLTLEQDGVLHGTPTTAGTASGVGIRLTNSVGTVARTFDISVNGLPALLTSGAPPDVVYSQPYTYQATATGSGAIYYGLAGRLPMGLSMDHSTGLLSGSTLELGDFPITVSAVNSWGSVDAHSYTLRVTGTSPIIRNTPPAATAGTGYRFAFDTSGTYPAPTFTRTSGTLPTGFTLYGDGQIWGYSTSAQPGSPITVTAHNAFAPDAEITFSLPVNPAPTTISGTPPTPVAVGADCYFRYTQPQGQAATTTVTGGTLPPGVSLSDDGFLTGYATTPGTYVFTITASGAGGDATITSTITVQGPPAAISGTPPAATVGAGYDFTYTLGGTPAPTTTVTVGALPPGVSLGRDGHLTGVPTSAGSYAFTVTADNGESPAATRNDTIVVRGQGATITGTPPSGGVGESYSFTFTTTGGPTVTRSAGTLPPGLTLSQAGKLSGAPTQAGSFSFTVRAQNNSADPVTSRVSLVIRPVPAISIDDAAVTEGNSGTKALSLRVSLSRASTVPVTVRWATANGTAAAGSDYTAASGTVTFAPGQTVRTVGVQVRGDRTRERHEGFVVRLSAPTHATVAKATGIGGIINDD